MRRPGYCCVELITHGGRLTPPPRASTPLLPRPSSKGSAYGTLQTRVTVLEALLKEHGIPLPPDPKGKGKAKEASAAAGTSSDDEDGAARPGKAGAVKQEDDDDDDWIPSFGTLELGKAGRARFVGATAGSLWLSNEVRRLGSPPATRPSLTSPLNLRAPQHMHSATPVSERQSAPSSGSFLAFMPSSVKPHSRDGPSTYAQLRARLPPRAEALYLVNLYYMEYSWLFVHPSRFRPHVVRPRD